jgi:NADPH2:quinone reductase
VRRQRASELFALIRKGTLVPTIAGTFPLRDGGNAHAFLESRGAIGKVVMLT